MGRGWRRRRDEDIEGDGEMGETYSRKENRWYGLWNMKKEMKMNKRDSEKKETEIGMG